MFAVDFSCVSIKMARSDLKAYAPFNGNKFFFFFLLQKNWNRNASCQGSAELDFRCQQQSFPKLRDNYVFLVYHLSRMTLTDTKLSEQGLLKAAAGPGVLQSR